MTMPESPPGEGMQGQILLKLGEISTQIAVITEQLKAVPDHETRLRILEHDASESHGTRDLVARVWSSAAALAAVATAVVAYLHK